MNTQYIETTVLYALHIHTITRKAPIFHESFDKISNSCGLAHLAEEGCVHYGPTANSVDKVYKTRLNQRLVNVIALNHVG